MKSTTKQERRVKGGVWKFTPNDSRSEEELLREREQHVDSLLSLGVMLGDDEGRFARGCAAIEQWRDYFPGDNEVPEDGGWILIKTPPPCEFTVPPLSLWFAEPWVMDNMTHAPHRVRIITPRGELGVFPREYSLVATPEKYYEFIGEGMDIKFFGAADTAIPPELSQKLFYIRSRGVNKADALAMLIGNIKAHGVLWVETRPEICAHFGMKWPAKSRLATA